MSQVVPSHIGFIIDGNRRWAKERNLPPYAGHERGYEVVKDILLDVLARGVKYASAYVFSTENWRRSKLEVDRIMALLVKVLRRDRQVFLDNQVRVRILGDRSKLNKKVIETIDYIEQLTADQAGGQLLICLNYGGKEEIAHAIRSLAESGQDMSRVSADMLEQNLYAPDVPPCDMIVRTGGEQRLSNFMLWRSAYSELMFIKKYWPDMTKRDVTNILNEYVRRNRRFGG